MHYIISSKELKVTKARRLTFSYKGTNIKIISQHKIEKVLPPSDYLDTKNNRSGFWYEITDDNQNILYQKSISNPIQTDIEVFSNKLEESIMRQKISQIEGTFSILIPDLPDAKTFSLFGNPIERDEISMQKPSIKPFQTNLDTVPK
jgi:hypothetical protein